MSAETLKFDRLIATRGAALGAIVRRSEAIVIPFAALATSLVLFSLFLLAVGKSPVDFFNLVYISIN